MTEFDVRQHARAVRIEVLREQRRWEEIAALKPLLPDRAGLPGLVLPRLRFRR